MISAAFGARVWTRLAPLTLIVGLVAVGLLTAGLTAQQAGARAADGNMSYQNGKVILHNTTRVVWWDAGVGFASGANDQGLYEQRAEDFLRGLEGSDYYHILSQYYETTNARPDGPREYIGPYSEFGGSVQDFSKPAADGNKISFATIKQEVKDQLQANGWTPGPSTIVILFAPFGYLACGVDGTCSAPSSNFCGFHDYVTTTDSSGAEVDTPFVVIPAPSNDLAGCAAHHTWPNGTKNDLYVQPGPAYAGDYSISAMSHELFEAITDPFPGTSAGAGLGPGWYAGGVAGEIGDLCANDTFVPFWQLKGNQGPPGTDNQDQDATVILDGQPFVAQKEWSNSDGGCVMRDSAPRESPQTPTVTATTADGKDYTFGTWTNQTVHVRPHGADAAGGLGLDQLALSFDGGAPTPVGFTVEDDGIHVDGNDVAVVAPGTTTVSATAHNYWLLSATSDTVDVLEDATPPDITFNAPQPDGQDGWYTSPVTLTAHPSDPLSGVKSTSCAVGNDAPNVTDGSDDVPVVVSANGTTTVTCTATDNAGNTSDPVSETIKIDTTPAPAVGLTVPPPVFGKNGWYDAADSSPVDVTVSASKQSGGSNITQVVCLVDGLSINLTNASGIGTTSVSATAPVAGNGPKGLSCTATDEAGKTSSPATATLMIDAIGPGLDGAPTSSPNANGWYNHDVVIHWTCSDSLSGILGGSCPANSNIGSEGLNQTANASVSDVAGNSMTQESPGVNIDKTAPSVSVLTPPVVHGTNGWYNGQDALPVMVGVTAVDAGGANGSGVAGVGCTLDNSPVAIVSGYVAVSADGIHHLFCGATDNAGNSSATGAPGSAATIKIDANAPSFSSTLTPASPAGSGWYNAATGAPTVSYTCSDPTSGLAVGCPSPYTFPQGASQTFSQTISDQAGNGNTITVGPLNVDTMPPTVNLSAPTANAVYGEGQSVTASYSCPDAVSGVASCVGSVASGSAIDTSNGPHSFTVTATDRAGNSTSTTVQYTAAAQLDPKTTTCNGYYVGSGKDVVVPAGAVCHLVAGASVSHDVTVQKGGKLDARGVTVSHDVTADTPAGVVVCGSAVSHDLTVKNGGSAASVLVGDKSGGCATGNTIGHDLDVENNAGPVDVGNNSVAHDVTVQGNKPGGAVVNRNSAGHDATCKGNSPQTGSGNTGAQSNTCPA
jgi:hypothetical protein